MSAATLAALRRGELAGARELTLRCALTEFPPEILALADTLELLDLSGNALTELPPEFSRLRKLRVFFASFNHFDQLPPVLGDCPSLSQVGLRGNAIREVPAESLPPLLRWLTLTDNRIEHLPDALGQRPALQKLMLAGNRLSALPDSLADAHALELLRISANRFDIWPTWITDLPSLAWLAWAGNPLEPALSLPSSTTVPWSHLRLGSKLGEGASGHIHQAEWLRDGHGAPQPVAVKLFKGAITSDGLPEREMAACLAAGAHPQLCGALGQVTDHPDQTQALVMPLLPAHWRPLAGPPSLASCSRDVYDPALRFTPDTAQRIALSVGHATAHLHEQGLSHGDLYAHNVLWDGASGHSLLSDLGAASCLPSGIQGLRLRRLDVRAFGLLLGELLARCDDPAPGWQQWAQNCMSTDAGARPEMSEVMAALGDLR